MSTPEFLPQDASKQNPADLGQAPNPNQTPQGSSKGVIAAVAVVVIAALSAGLYFFDFFSSDASTVPNPPTLEAEVGSTKQGFIGKRVKLNQGVFEFLALEDTDLKKIQENTKKSAAAKATTTSLNAGLNYITFDDDMTFEDILYSLEYDSKLKDTVFAIAYYDDSKSRFTITSNNYYKDRDKNGNKLLDKLDFKVVKNGVVPKGKVAVFATSQPVKMFKAHTGTSFAEKPFDICNLQNKGWHNVRLSQKDTKAELSTYSDYIDGVFIQNNASADAKDFFKEYDITKLPTNSKYSLAWLYLGKAPKTDNSCRNFVKPVKADDKKADDKKADDKKADDKKADDKKADDKKADDKKDDDKKSDDTKKATPITVAAPTTLTGSYNKTTKLITLAWDEPKSDRPDSYEVSVKDALAASSVKYDDLSQKDNKLSVQFKVEKNLKEYVVTLVAVKNDGTTVTKSNETKYTIKTVSDVKAKTASIKALADAAYEITLTSPDELPDGANGYFYEAYSGNSVVANASFSLEALEKGSTLKFTTRTTSLADKKVKFKVYYANIITDTQAPTHVRIPLSRIQYSPELGLGINLASNYFAHAKDYGIEGGTFKTQYVVKKLKQAAETSEITVTKAAQKHSGKATNSSDENLVSGKTAEQIKKEAEAAKKAAEEQAKKDAAEKAKKTVFPTSLAIETDSNTGTVLIVWDAPSNSDIKKYIGILNDSEGKAIKQLNLESKDLITDTKGKLKYAFKDLANGKYSVKIAADGENYIAADKWTDFEVKKPEVYAPLNINSATAGDGQITVKWDVPSYKDKIDTYAVNWGTAEETTGKSIKKADYDASKGYTISSLTNGSQYVVSVAACDSNSNCSQATSKTLTPKAPDKSTLSPIQISDVEVGDAKARITWKNPFKGAIEKYLIKTYVYGNPKYTQVGSDITLNVTSSNQSDFEYKQEISNLKNGSTYYFTVQACEANNVCTELPTNNAGGVIYEKAELLAYNPIVITSLTSSDKAVTVKWDKPSYHDKIRNYHISYFVGNDSGVKTISRDDYSANGIEVKDLTNNLEYTFTVHACDSNTQCSPVPTKDFNGNEIYKKATPSAHN